MTNFANGAELLNYRKDSDQGNYVILAKTAKDYVTARMTYLTDKEWYWGHYFSDQDNARKDFRTR